MDFTQELDWPQGVRAICVVILFSYWKLINLTRKTTLTSCHGAILASARSTEKYKFQVDVKKKTKKRKNNVNLF